MYTILVTNENELITSVKERIMQRSKLVDSLHFLVEPMYKELDMTDFTVTMEYLLPVSKEYCSETLIKSEELYKERLEYKLPFDTKLTKEAGDIEVQLTFTKVDMIEENTEDSNVEIGEGDTSDETESDVSDEHTDVEIEGQDLSDTVYKTIQYVRKTSPVKIQIVPISAWSDIIPDSALTALDQRMLKVDAYIKALSETGDTMATTKADNIVLNKDTNELYLTANGEPIGDKVNMEDFGDTIIQSSTEGIVTMMI